MTTIGLALSGGGYRAAGFHLGVLARLAQAGQLENVSLLSTVSGGSMCVGLIMAINGLRWPTSQEYLQRVLPEAKRLLQNEDLQQGMINYTILRPWTFFGSRANLLSKLMQQRWGLTQMLTDLPAAPRWMINASCHETGKDWRFESFRMGDYLFGYTWDPELPIADAVASSAGFPGLIGPLWLDTTRFKWFQYDAAPPDDGVGEAPERTRRRTTRAVSPAFPTVHLWDGGVYDNHGLEGIFDFQTGWKDKIDFLIVSDGSGRGAPAAYQRGAGGLYRLVSGIMMDQVRSLRTRAILERITVHHDPGVFLQIGNTSRELLGQTESAQALLPACLPDEECGRAAGMATMIGALSEEVYNRLVRHGYEVADATLFRYYPQEYPFAGWQR